MGVENLFFHKANVTKKEFENLWYAINMISREIPEINEQVIERGKENEQEKTTFQGRERCPLYTSGGKLHPGYSKANEGSSLGEVSEGESTLSSESQKRYIISAPIRWNTGGAFGGNGRFSCGYDTRFNGTDAESRTDTGKPQRYGYFEMGWVDEQLQILGRRDSYEGFSIPGRNHRRDGRYDGRDTGFRHRRSFCGGSARAGIVTKVEKTARLATVFCAGGDYRVTPFQKELIAASNRL
jgi:hypothetical protein